MKNGNISSHSAPTILVRMEDTLFKSSETKLLGFNVKTTHELQENTLSLLIRLSMHTDYRVELVCSPQNYNKLRKLMEQLSESYQIPFARICYHSEQTITNFLNNGIYYCYIDNNLDRIGRVNHKSCYTVAEFTNLAL